MEEKLVEAFIQFTTRGFDAAMKQAKQLADAVGGARSIGSAPSAPGGSPAAAAQSMSSLVSMASRHSVTVQRISATWTQVTGTMTSLGGLLAKAGPWAIAIGAGLAAAAIAAIPLALAAKAFSSAFAVNREALARWDYLQKKIEAIFQRIGQPFAKGAEKLLEQAIRAADIVGRLVDRLMSLPVVVGAIEGAFQSLEAMVFGILDLIEGVLTALNMLGNSPAFKRLGNGAQFMGLTDYSKRVQSSLSLDPNLQFNKETAANTKRIADMFQAWASALKPFMPALPGF